MNTKDARETFRKEYGDGFSPETSLFFSMLMGITMLYCAAKESGSASGESGETRLKGGDMHEINSKRTADHEH